MFYNTYFVEVLYSLRFVIRVARCLRPVLFCVTRLPVHRIRYIKLLACATERESDLNAEGNRASKKQTVLISCRSHRIIFDLIFSPATYQHCNVFTKLIKWR